MSTGNLVYLIYLALFGSFGIYELMRTRRSSVVKSHDKYKKPWLWKITESFLLCTNAACIILFIVCFFCLFLYLSSLNNVSYSYELIALCGNALFLSMGLFAVAMVSEFTFISALRVFWMTRPNSKDLQ